ncbi:MAG TPA: hydroxyisourate hydrolase [Crenalkalicoccus sp.]|nr:hydroxyisourate hydrolase [Crenalkalicoccus sp.]
MPGCRLTTHVLDTARGVPAAGVRVELHRIAPGPAALEGAMTDADGRAVLLPEDAFRPGRYELRFHIGAYFAATGLAEDPPFLDIVPVRVLLPEGRAQTHVPLLCAPFGYTTYRGS